MVLIVFISVTLRFEYTLEKTITEYDEKTLIDISKEIENSNNKTKDLILALNNTPQINLLKFVNDDDIAIYRAVKMLKQISPYSHSYLYSLYIYNTVSDKIYTFGNECSFYSSENFPDQDVLIYLNSDQNYNINPVIRTIDSPDGPVDVYTYIVSETKTKNNKKGEAIIINITIDEMFNEIVSTDESNISLYNSDTKQFFKNYGDIESNQLETLLLDYDIGNNESGHFYSEINNEKYIITYTTLKQPNWIVCSITSTEKVFEPIRQTKRIIIMIFIILVVIILLTSYSLSVYLYKPLKKIINKLPPGIDSNEFNHITNYIEDSNKELEKYYSKMQKNTPIVKTKFLADLLKGAYDNKEEIIDQFNSMNINFDVDGNYLLVRIIVDEKNSYLSHFSSLEQLNFRNLNIIFSKKMISTRYSCEAYYNNDYSRFTMLIDISKEKDIEKIYAFLKKCFETINNNYFNSVGYNLSFFVTSSFKIEEINKMYDSLLILQNEKFFYGKNSIIFNDTLTFKEEETNNSDLDINQLIDSIIQLKKIEVENILKEIFFKLGTYKYDYCISMILYINTSLFETFQKIEKNKHENFNLDYSNSIKKITDAEYLNDVYLIFLNNCNFVMDNLSEYRSDYRDEIVNQINTLINNNYNDFNLTATQIADRFNLTTAYIGKIYRNVTGESISNAITEVRLNKASELLNNSKLTVNEITALVGWENNKYFYNKFKLKFGVTPFQYRNK